MRGQAELHSNLGASSPVAADRRPPRCSHRTLEAAPARCRNRYAHQHGFFWPEEDNGSSCDNAGLGDHSIWARERTSHARDATVVDASRPTEACGAGKASRKIMNRTTLRPVGAVLAPRAARTPWLMAWLAGLARVCCLLALRKGRELVETKGRSLPLSRPAAPSVTPAPRTPLEWYWESQGVRGAGTGERAMSGA